MSVDDVALIFDILAASLGAVTVVATIWEYRRRRRSARDK